jgi:hypothetical protein
MAVGTDKILGPAGAGLLDSNGKLTKSARDKFCVDVLSIMANGNENGMGLLHTVPPLPLPVFPVPGPKVAISITNPSGEDFFWFKPDPLIALASTPVVLDPQKEYQKLIIDKVYEPLCGMLNVSGKTSLGPVFDPTIFVDLSKPKFANIKLPDIPSLLAEIIIQANLAAPGLPTMPAAKIKLALDYGISDLKILDLIQLVLAPPIPLPPIIVIPEIPIPPLPSSGIPSFIMPDLVLGLFKIPLDLLPQLITLITSISIDPMDLFTKIIELIVKMVLSILEKLGMIVGVPKLLLSSLMVIIKNMTGMLLCVIIGSLLGTGALVKIVSTLIGLA